MAGGAASTNLMNANLYKPNLRQMNLTDGADLRLARLDMADLTDAIYDSTTQRNGAEFYTTTILEWN